MVEIDFGTYKLLTKSPRGTKGPRWVERFLLNQPAKKFCMTKLPLSHLKKYCCSPSDFGWCVCESLIWKERSGLVLQSPGEFVHIGDIWWQQRTPGSQHGSLQTAWVSTWHYSTGRYLNRWQPPHLCIRNQDWAVAPGVILVMLFGSLLLFFIYWETAPTC